MTGTAGAWNPQVTNQIRPSLQVARSAPRTLFKVETRVRTPLGLLDPPVALRLKTFHDLKQGENSQEGSSAPTSDHRSATTSPEPACEAPAH
jgi:hypothetical protein